MPSPAEARALAAFVTKDERLRSMLEVLAPIARSECTLLITGETGTGKEHLARLVHFLSPRRRGPFVKIGCAGLAEDQLAGQVFGYGAGGVSPGEPARPGALELASRGTLFLDEVGELPPGLQEDLLGLLQGRTCQPRGGGQGLALKARLLAASKVDLEELVRGGAFRQDLCHRLALLRFHLPPLRERQGDLPLLIEHFLARLNQGFPGAPRSLSDQVWRVLLAYHYPGNLRELGNILEQAVMVCRGGPIGLADLPAFLGGQAAPVAAGQAALGPGQGERRAILEALAAHGWRRRAAAQALGMDRTTLWRKMRRLGLNGPASDQPA